jgi:hypothetical protein
MKSARLVFALALTLVVATGPPVSAQTTAAAVFPASVTLVGLWEDVWTYFFDEASGANPDPCPDCQAPPPPPPTCLPNDPDCIEPVPPPDDETRT